MGKRELIKFQVQEGCSNHPGNETCDKPTDAEPDKNSQDLDKIFHDGINDTAYLDNSDLCCAVHIRSDDTECCTYNKCDDKPVKQSVIL